MGDRLIDVLAPDQKPVPTFKKRDVKLAVQHAKAVIVRLNAMRRAKNQMEYRDLRGALIFDFRQLQLDMQTL